MKHERPTIGIIGLGPVGSILAAHLADNGEDVVVVDIIQELLLTIKERGLKISGFKDLTTRIKHTASSIDSLAEFTPEIVFISTKACVLQKILPAIKKIYHPRMKIVSFQNGLDTEQLISETLGIDTTYRVVINYAGNSLSFGNVKMNWFQPPNHVGAFHEGKYTRDETTQSIANMMTTCGLTTAEATNIKQHVWEKTILNSALCSICAITGQTMKEAMEFEPTRTLASEILEEGLTLAKKDGYDYGQGSLDRFISYLEKGGAHKPSMLIDVEYKRPTEVDFMSGAIARYGAKYGIPTPVNSTFTHLLKTKEQQYSKL